MNTSVIYRSAWLYEAFLVLRYRGEYEERSRAVAELIPDGSSVVDLCCGPGTLYFRHLRHKKASYTGLDINSSFVKRLSSRGIATSTWDASSDKPLPRADYLVMQGSLYHFLPDPYPVIDRMIAAAKQKVILTEPITNLANSKNPFVSWLARKLANPGTGDQPHRFNESSFEKLVELYKMSGRLLGYYAIAGGRERLCVLRGVGA